jgi:hypothetical protein
MVPPTSTAEATSVEVWSATRQMLGVAVGGPG